MESQTQQEKEIKVLTQRTDQGCADSLAEDNKMQEMKASIAEICNSLSQNDNFDEIGTARKIKNYLDTYDRILYSEISNYIFRLDANSPNNRMQAMQTNIDMLVDNAMKGILFTNEEQDEQKKLKKILLKLYDHINLASQQYQTLRQSDEEFQRRFTDNFKPEREKIAKEISSGITTQLITLISIFTAIAFVLFGGVNSIGTLFTSASDLPFVKVMAIACIWGLAMMNILYVFMFCAGKLSSLTLSSTKENRASMMEKYPIVCWSNLIMMAMSLSLSWFYYCQQIIDDSFIGCIVKNHNTIAIISGFLVIIFILSFLFYILNKKSEG